MSPDAARASLLIVLTLSAIAGGTALWLSQERPGYGPIPQFPRDDAAERKRQFFAWLRPIVQAENERIMAQRVWLGQIDGEPSALQRWRLQRLAREYDVPEDLPLDEALALLKRRVAPVPASLVLAQAAKESGWGSSRFAREGNALFGQRCYDPGCGIVPRNRARGARFQVKSFPSAAHSVRSYLKNLNTHDRYVDLRIERQKLLAAGSQPRGSELVPFTLDYSERRDAYVREVRSLIRANQLESSTATADARPAVTP